MSKPKGPSDLELRALCARAGVLPEEMKDHPEHGLLISPSGAKKLAALAPDNAQTMKVRQRIAEVQAAYQDRCGQ